MSDAAQTAQTAASEQQKPRDFDAFLSYAHSDRLVVAGIQKGLHRIGRRLGQLRALRVFRDNTRLTASSDLFASITEAIDRSRFFLLTLSPQAARSDWVNREVSYWLAHRGSQQLLLALAGGRLHWDAATERFDPQASDAAPPVLLEPGVLPAEPLFIDVSQDARGITGVRRFGRSSPRWRRRSTASPKTSWPAMICVSSGGFVDYAPRRSPRWWS